MNTSDPLAFLNALGDGGNNPALARADDATRIRDLPVVDVRAPDFEAVAMSWASSRWSRGPDAPMQFRPIQAVTLLTVHLTGGGLLPIGTGWGKTLVSMLAADAMGARRPLLLIPPAMRASFEAARREYSASFRIPSNLRVLAYSQLSTSASTDMLDRLAPDVIVADEAHNLRHMDAARTKRVSRYLKKNRGTRCVWASGTLTSKSIRDYAHLAEWALGTGSPAPLTTHYPQLQAFAAVLDAKPVKARGDERYNAPAQLNDFVIFAPLFPDWKAWSNEPEDADAESETSEVVCTPRVRQARKLFRERLVSTPGVVTTSEASVGAALNFIERTVDLPEVVAYHLNQLELTWTRPDGEELQTAIEKWRCGRQLTQGFYYRWTWPDGIVDKAWMATRSAWHREVRAIVQRNEPHLDSPMLVARAARRALSWASGVHATETRPPAPMEPQAEDYTLVESAAYEKDKAAWRVNRLAWENWRPAVGPGPLADEVALLQALEDWLPHSTKRWGRLRTPPTETVWIHDYVLRDALAWVQDNPTGLVWYEDNAVGNKLAELGLQVYGSGRNPEDIAGRHAGALSAFVHSDGKNLQKHSANLLLSTPPNGKTMEQLVSRTHRAGQMEDTVTVEFYHHTEPAKKAIAEARNDARYIQDTTGVGQRLVYGDWIFSE